MKKMPLSLNERPWYKYLYNNSHDIMSRNDPENGTGPYKERSDKLQQFFSRPFFLSLTIGVPFCIFKLLFGITLVRVGSDMSSTVSVIGWIVTAWALADLIMNMGRELFDLMNRPAPFEYCTIAQVGRLFSMPMVFLAIDTLLTFTIICIMLWSGWIATLTMFESYCWYAATTLNLISLSLVVLYNEMRTIR